MHLKKKNPEGYPCNIARFYIFDILLESFPTLSIRSIGVRLIHINKENKISLQILGKLERNGLKGGERKEGDNSINQSTSFANFKP